MTASFDCFALMACVVGLRAAGYGTGISGDVLGDSEGTALIDGVKSVLRDSESELPFAVPGRRPFEPEWSLPPLNTLPIFPLRVELSPSKWVRKSLFSMAEATIIGRGGLRTGGAGYPYVLLADEKDRRRRPGCGDDDTYDGLVEMVGLDEDIGSFE